MDVRVGDRARKTNRHTHHFLIIYDRKTISSFTCCTPRPNKDGSSRLCDCARDLLAGITRDEMPLISKGFTGM